MKKVTMLVFLVITAILGMSSYSYAMEYDTNRPGSDYKNFDLSAADPALCQQACQNEDKCKSYTYVKPGFQGPKARCWLKHSVPQPRSGKCCVSGIKGAGHTAVSTTPVSSSSAALEYDTNRPGSDYKNFDLSAADPALCQQACQNEDKCKSYTYVKPGFQGPKARCWLKHSVPQPRSGKCCVSGVK